jgi:Family of unknown function (DUF5819)
VLARTNGQQARWKAETRVRQRYGNLDEVEPRVDDDSPPDDSPPEDPASPKPPKALRVALGAVAALCVATTLTHLLMVFLQVAPSNPISERFDKQIHAWIYPWFEQSWYLFAPNPQSNQIQIFARTMTTSGDKQASDWFDISAVDRADVRHNPFPSHTTQNMLQTSWELYQESFGDGYVPSASTPLQEEYLRNIAVQRVAAHSPHPFQQIQLRVVTQLIAPPDGANTTPTDSTDPETATLPWWNVTPHGS